MSLLRRIQRNDRAVARAYEQARQMLDGRAQELSAEPLEVAEVKNIDAQHWYVRMNDGRAFKVRVWGADGKSVPDIRGGHVAAVLLDGNSRPAAGEFVIPVSGNPYKIEDSLEPLITTVARQDWVVRNAVEVAVGTQGAKLVVLRSGEAALHDPSKQTLTYLRTGESGLEQETRFGPTDYGLPFANKGEIAAKMTRALAEHERQVAHNAEVDARMAERLAHKEKGREQVKAMMSPIDKPASTVSPVDDALTHGISAA